MVGFCGGFWFDFGLGFAMVGGWVSVYGGRGGLDFLMGWWWWLGWLIGF